MRNQLDATIDDEKGRFETQCEFHLGDYVNVFRHGILNSQPSDSEKSGNSLNILGSIMYGTMSGAIGTILGLDEENFNVFEAIESAMKKAFPAVVGINHQDWRDFNNGRRNTPQKNFIDGDLVETFLELDKEDIESVAVDVNSFYQSKLASKGIKPVTVKPFTVENLLRKVEDMARSH